jgi:enoyl-CoA hydratase/carnithine racemase
MGVKIGKHQMQHIQITHQNHILHLHIAREEKKNALTGAMYMAMVEAITSANTDDNTRAIVISAAGTIFTAGNDIADFLGYVDNIETSPPARFIHAIATNKKPLIAAVNGKAVGIGTTMLLHCDLVYAAPDASFSTPFVDLGLIPEAGASLLLPMRIGHVRASQMLLLGETMPASEAFSAGLINAIIPFDDLFAYTLQKAAILARKSPNALLASRKLMHPNQDILLKHIDNELKQFGKALQSSEARKAFIAFMGKK